ncbi:MAG TPA: transglutaminase-like cysteine peptidase [Hyphomicrobiaceae bacterium]|nr:transglutaminase-like cysteine peptidase [Hyphomicrobiaceae bacterium]
MSRVAQGPAKAGFSSFRLLPLTRHVVAAGAVLVCAFGWASGSLATRGPDEVVDVAVQQPVTAPVAMPDDSAPGGQETAPSTAPDRLPLRDAAPAFEPKTPSVWVAGLGNDAVPATVTRAPLQASAPPESDASGTKRGRPQELAMLDRSPPVAPRVETKPPEGLKIFGSVPVPTSSRALRKVVGTAFSEAVDWTPEACADGGTREACLKDVPARWRSLANERAGDPVAVLKRVNAEVNARIGYRTDMDAHGVLDRWASPQETLAEAAGDCEDFATLKMWLLGRMGFKAEDMFVLVVRSDQLKSEHAVLVVRTGSEVYVLDSLKREISAAPRITHYFPIFSVNAKGLWLHGFEGKKEMASLDRRRN